MTHRLNSAEALALLLQHVDYQREIAVEETQPIAYALPGEVLEQCRQARDASPQAGADEYLIWSHEHAGWWGPAHNGYTRTLAAAGVYSWADARQICENAGWTDKGHAPNEIPVRCADALALEVAAWRQR